VSLDYTGIALLGVDFSGISSATITAGQTGLSFTVTSTDDQYFENGNETFTLSVSGVVNGFEFGTQVQNMTIIDDETTPSIALTGGTSIVESG